jgi:hypothetical protein
MRGGQANAAGGQTRIKAARMQLGFLKVVFVRSKKL